MTEAEFCGQLCAALLSIPQITGVSVDIHAGKITVLYRVYDVLEGTFSFSTTSLHHSTITHEDLIGVMVQKAKDDINAPAERDDK